VHYWLGVLLATIGASLILFALTFVSTLVGVLANAMIALMLGPVIDQLLARRRRGSVQP
jgi:multisubunit Na+/H+ antiporter MnhG subunit